MYSVCTQLLTSRSFALRSKPFWTKKVSLSYTSDRKWELFNNRGWPLNMGSLEISTGLFIKFTLFQCKIA